MHKGDSGDNLSHLGALSAFGSLSDAHGSFVESFGVGETSFIQIRGSQIYNAIDYFRMIRSEVDFFEGKQLF
ncbi:MAG: hypothetical protein BWY75_03874 [bacterium ADurb.Bin425]|nr:MAG: hypothetical protein BWY75_03874 [bacterium ADurb.Bin425]